MDTDLSPFMRLKIMGNSGKKSVFSVGVRVGNAVLLEKVSPHSQLVGSDGRCRQKQAVWRVVCDCGRERLVPAANLYRGRVACECTKHPSPARTHGMSNSPEHKAWTKIRERCFCKSSKDYADYGGRGITMCDRWLESFENFYADMGAKPTPTHSIDRLDVNGHYEPGNCRWATAVEQANNKRTTCLVTAFGETLPLAVAVRKWGTKAGLYRQAVFKRIKRGWDHEEALTTPIQS